jgi:hypothetical protein
MFWVFLVLKYVWAMTRAASVFPAPGGPTSNRGFEGIAVQYCCMMPALSGSAITRSSKVDGRCLRSKDMFASMRKMEKGDLEAAR